jgi:integrase
LGFLKVTKAKTLTEVTKTDVINFMDYLEKEGYSQKTRVDRYVSLRGFLKNHDINVKKLLESVHAQFSFRPEGNTDEYPQDQLDKLFDACDEYHRNVYQFLLATGLRFREANHLTWLDLSLTKWVIKLRDERVTHQEYEKAGVVIKKKVTAKTKSGKGREVPIFPSIRPLLLEWRGKYPDRKFVFGSQRSDMPDNHWLSYGKKAWKRAGLNCGTCDGCVSKSQECESFFIHRFRHSFCHRCLDAGIGIHKVSKWVGHHSIEQTQVYLSGASTDADCDPFA